jgi:hypothetical protein
MLNQSSLQSDLTDYTLFCDQEWDACQKRRITHPANKRKSKKESGKSDDFQCQSGQCYSGMLYVLFERQSNGTIRENAKIQNKADPASTRNIENSDGRFNKVQDSRISSWQKKTSTVAVLGQELAKLSSTINRLR